MNKLILTLAVATFLAAISAQAGYSTGLIVSYAGSAGAMSSTVQDASVLTFDGMHSANSGHQSNLNWSGVGTIDSVYVRTANQYGGANNTDYAVQSSSSGLGDTPKTTLTLNHSSSYFGLWWSAGDAKNVLDFYSGGTGGKLVAQFVTADLGSLPATYRGNPNTGSNRGADGNEYFSFLNFFGNGVSWDTVVFSNLGSSGFESDNWTSRVAAWGSGPHDSGPLPGVPVIEINGTTVSTISSVPEPGNFTSTLMIGFIGSLSAGVMALRRSKNQIKA